MKNPNPTLGMCFPHVIRSNQSTSWRKMSGLTFTGVMMLLALTLLSLPAPAQSITNIMTFKPFQIRAEVQPGFVGTIYLTNNNLRVPTNGATGFDGTGTNWVIAPVNVSISGAPSGCTASLVAQDLATVVSTLTFNLNTNNSASNTNFVIRLVFDGSQASGVTTLAFLASGAGLPDDPFNLPLEVANIYNGPAVATANGVVNWGDGTQWLGGAPTGGTNSVVFTDLGAQTNSLVWNSSSTNYLTNVLISANVTLGSLRFAMTNGTGTILTNYHNIYINPNVNLAINGNDGFALLRDFTYWNARPMNISIWGTNGMFIQTNENSSFSILSDAKVQSVLDMSGLGNLYLDINRFYLSDYLGYPNYMNLVYTNNYSGTTIGTGKPQQFYQTWRMAMTNFVRATYKDPNDYNNAGSRTYALTLGHNEASGGSSGQFVEMWLGRSNVFYLDGLCVGGSFCLGADLRFPNTNSYALFRGTNGGRMSIFATADAGGPTQPASLGNIGDNTKCGGNGPGADFSGSRNTVDILVDRFYLSLDRPNVVVSGKGVSQTSGFVIANPGTIIDANTAILGYQSQGNQTNQSICYANMIVSNGAVFRVNGTLALGYTTWTTGAANPVPSPYNPGYGVLTIGPGGGTVMASNVTVGGVSKKSAGNNISLLGGASLITSNGIADATPNGAVGTFTMSGNNDSLTLFIDGSKPLIPLVYVTNFTASGTGNKLVIGSVQNLTYPADVPLIGGVGPAISAASFDAGVVMPGGLFGTLTTSSSNTINVHIISGAGKRLLWRAPAGTANWDYVTKNWLDQDTGLMTNFANPDAASFDDTPGYATNIVLVGAAMTPAAVNVTNNSLYYTITGGGGKIIGGYALNKYGTGTVEVDGDAELSVSVNQGTLTGLSSGTIANANVGTGAVMSFAGTIIGSLQASGTATYSGPNIAGTVTVLSGGIVTNSGTVNNPISVLGGGFLYNSGTLNNVGTGSSGSPQVSSNATLINGGTLNGDVLYVNGTIEDLGASVGASMTLTSLSLGSSGTFIPGGDGIGTTFIYSDFASGFPGAALLTQGSQTIFKVNPGTPPNTMLSCVSLSFGASASQQTQSGCTLVVSNVSLTPFSIGQTFPLFYINSQFGQPGQMPSSTGSSTNTFPVIVPATPGPGMAWDLSHLWAPNAYGTNGILGVVSSSSTLKLTSSFTFANGTNIVGQFSWPTLGWRLQSLTTPNDVGVVTNSLYNWSGVAGSFTNTSMTITNVVGTNNGVYYRLVFP